MKSERPERYRDVLTTMTSEEKAELWAETWAIEWVECAGSVERFAMHCKTKDEHASGTFSIRAFPSRAEKPYLWGAVMDPLRSEKLLLIEKSRQVMATWACCLDTLWMCKFQKNRLCFVQSKKEEDAANLVYNKEPQIARMSFIEANLPAELRSIEFDRDCSYGQMWIPEMGSKIWAIPEGGEKIRSYTASRVFSDEFAHQPSAHEAWKAAKPTVTGGGQFVGVSSASAGAYMAELLRK